MQRCWTVAPPINQPLRQGHPLCNGLVVFVRPNSYVPRNLTGGGLFGQTWTSSSTGTGFGGQTPLGEGWGQLSQNGQLTLPASSLPSLSTFTIVWYGMALSFPVSTYPYISEMTPEFGTTAFLRFGDAALAANRAQFVATTTGQNGASTIATCKPVIAAASYNVSSNSITRVLYVNGIRDAFQSSAGTSTQIPGLGFGWSSYGARGLDGWHAYMGVWNRVLTPTEVQTLSTNPWCMFQQPFAPINVGASSAGRWGVTVGVGI